MLKKMSLSFHLMLWLFKDIGRKHLNSKGKTTCNNLSCPLDMICLFDRLFLARVSLYYRLYPIHRKLKISFQKYFFSWRRYGSSIFPKQFGASFRKLSPFTPGYPAGAHASCFPADVRFRHIRKIGRTQLV